jgi:hypothetical protein
MWADWSFDAEILDMLALFGNQEARATAFTPAMAQAADACVLCARLQRVFGFSCVSCRAVCRFLWRALGQELAWTVCTAEAIDMKDPRVMVVLRGLRWMCSVV